MEHGDELVEKLLYVLLLISLFVLLVGIVKKNERKEKGIVFQFDSKHIFGIPDMNPGDQADIFLKKEVLMINNLQTIPYNRVISLECVQETEIKLDEKQKSVILRALTGGIFLGPIGAIVGGMSGIGSEKTEKEVEQNYIQIEYENKNGEVVKALLLTEYTKSFCNGIIKKAYEIMGKEMSTQHIEKAVEPYEI